MGYKFNLRRRCAARTAKGKRCKAGGTVLEGVGFYCRQHAKAEGLKVPASRKRIRLAWDLLHSDDLMRR